MGDYQKLCCQSYFCVQHHQSNTQAVTMASGLGMQGDQITKEDVRRVEHEESAGHKAGNIPAGSDAAAMQSMMDKRTRTRAKSLRSARATFLSQMSPRPSPTSTAPTPAPSTSAL